MGARRGMRGAAVGIGVLVIAMALLPAPVSLAGPGHARGGTTARSGAAKAMSQVQAWAPRSEPTWFDHISRAGRPRSAHLARVGAVRRRGSVVLDGSPGAPAANPATHTLYVPIQCRSSFCPESGAPARVVDVINTARCNAKLRSGCRVVARARVRNGPLAATVDVRTDTVYVVDDTNTVSVLNGARCNASVVRGCGRPVATVKVGKSPVAAALNARTRTLYVANLGGGSVSVINIAACNAHTTRGCGRRVRTVPDKAGPAWIDINAATDTVYVANGGQSGHGDTVSVIDGATCNGHTGRGCARIVATVRVGSGAFGVAVDQANNTIYVPGNDTGTVSVINGARCNATVTAGCRRTPPTVTTGVGPQFVAVDRALHTLFTVNQGDDTLSAVDTRTCGRTVTSGCRERPPTKQATAVQGAGFNSFPNAVTLVRRAGTAYVVNIGGRRILSITSIRHCNATDTTGCRVEAPTTPERAFLISADPATNTIYASSLSAPRIDVLSGATCHPGRLSGCRPVAQIPMADAGANVSAVDDRTHTLYAADSSSGKVAVINTATCNATNTTGCDRRKAMVTIGRFPSTPVVNVATHTMYVPFGGTGNRIAVVNAAICNAGAPSGCGNPQAVIRVRPGTSNIAVSAATNTIFATNSGLNGFDGTTVSVINGATCDSNNHSGCGGPTATAKVGSGPFGIAVNDRTHTAYVANNANGDSPGTVSVINSATCNGSHTRGCHRHFPTMRTGVSPLLVAVNPRTNVVYVTDFSSATVSILNGARCSASAHNGCGPTLRRQAVRSRPFGLAVNPHTNAVYVAHLFQAGSMSVFRGARG